MLAGQGQKDGGRDRNQRQIVLDKRSGSIGRTRAAYEQGGEIEKQTSRQQRHKRASTLSQLTSSAIHAHPWHAGSAGECAAAEGNRNVHGRCRAAAEQRTAMYRRHRVVSRDMQGGAKDPHGGHHSPGETTPRFPRIPRKREESIRTRTLPITGMGGQGHRGTLIPASDLKKGKALREATLFCPV